MLPDDRLSLREGHLLLGIDSSNYPQMLEQAMIHFGDYGPTFFRSFSRRKDLVLYGSNGKGIPLPLWKSLVGFGISKFLWRVVNNIHRRFRETNSDFTRNQMRSYMNELTCATCHGYRLNDQAFCSCWWGRRGCISGKCQIYRLRTT